MKKYLFWLVLVSFVAGPVLAGVVFEVETTDHSRGEPTSEDIEVKADGKNLTMAIPSAERRVQGSMIYRGERREMVVVDHDSSSYMVIDEEAVQAMAGEVDAAMSQIEEALANVPPEQRAMVEKMLKERMPQQVQQPTKGPSSQLRKTGERGEHSGFPCLKYDVLVDGKKARELWVTDWDNVEGGEEVSGIFLEMAEFFEGMMAKLPRTSGFGQVDGHGFEHMKELGGFPVVTREFADDGSLRSESVLRSAKRQTLDPEAFEPPAGYKRQDMFGTR